MDEDRFLYRLGWALWIASFLALFPRMNNLWFVCLLGAVLLWTMCDKSDYFGNWSRTVFMVVLLWLVWLLITISKGGFFV